ncbi:MAG TPA: DUF6152 family protein [Caulobacteraceae bacterium]|jgi:hypothetical protein|nr:DUF6152 family protein [Caulobacteraceae bacterium]
MKRTCLPAAAGVLAAALAGSALAHHSNAMFEARKQVTVNGTVVDFEYTNPHAWLVVDVPGAAGKAVRWSFESDGPSTLLRSGIAKSSLVAGDKVSITGRPLRDGRPGGRLIKVVKADGTVLEPHPNAEAPR